MFRVGGYAAARGSSVSAFVDRTDAESAYELFDDGGHWFVVTVDEAGGWVSLLVGEQVRWVQTDDLVPYELWR